MALCQEQAQAKRMPVSSFSRPLAGVVAIDPATCNLFLGRAAADEMAGVALDLVPCGFERHGKRQVASWSQRSGNGPNAGAAGGLMHNPRPNGWTYGCGSKKNVPEWHLGKWNQRLKPAVCPGSLILSHTPLGQTSGQCIVQKMGSTLCLCKRAPGSNLLQQRGRVAHRLPGCCIHSDHKLLR